MNIHRVFTVLEAIIHTDGYQVKSSTPPPREHRTFKLTNDRTLVQSCDPSCSKLNVLNMFI